MRPFFLLCCAPVADFCAEQFVPGFPGFDGAELARSYLWQRIGFGARRCLRKVPAVWLFGGPELVALFGCYVHEAMVDEH